MLACALRESKSVSPVLWYQTPMALPWTEDIASDAVVYDCWMS